MIAFRVLRPDDQTTFRRRFGWWPAWLWSARLWSGILTVAAIVVLWTATPLRDLMEVERMAALGRTLRASPAAPWIAVAAYGVGALVLFPITVLLAATALVFPAPAALPIGVAGAALGGAIGFAIGRLARRGDPAWLRGPRVARIRGWLTRRGMGVAAIAGARVLPAGNFSLINIAAAALGVRFRDFMLGNALGVLPGLLALTVLGAWLRRG